MKHQDIIDQLTLEEKASLLSGKNYWHTKPIKRLNIPSIMMTDGPHGLRKQPEEGTSVHESVKATCFPTAVTTAASWDTDLLYKLGECIAEEALKEQVSIVLGPGVNIKRSPLCGRNFEYFSEDPLLAGHLASSFINGVQSKGIGTSLKHFAANNQEMRRMTISSVVDMRTLREMYLTQFEIAVKYSHPTTLMCSYNRINGVYSSENPLILTDILRKDWGYDGVVMTDWGAVNDRPLGVKAGLDLEMPGSNGINDDKIVSAVKDGSLDISYVDTAVDNMLELILSSASNIKTDATYDIEEHNKISEDIATESAVLLKNKNDILPLDKTEKILVVGALADKPRYQGAGSSHICPHKTTSLLEGLKALGVDYAYQEGYALKSSHSSDAELAKAIDMASNYDKILLVVGLTDEYEAEGFDRSNLELPKSHTALIDAMVKLGKKIVVNIECGSPVTMPWIDDVDGVLLSYLGGQATGGAAAKLLYGAANPSGKLAETFPMRLEDNPSYAYFPGDNENVEYREGVYVGYRYYLTAGVKTLFPFGYGLSYTTFDYKSLNIDKTEYNVGDEVKLNVEISNTGDMAGKEIVEVFVAPHSPYIDRPIRELKAFKKVKLEPHETKSIEFSLDKRAFAYYDVKSADFIVDKGDFDIIVARNAEDMSLVKTITFVDGNTTDNHLGANSWYNNVSADKISDEDFSELLGHDIPKSATLPRKGDFTTDNCFADMMPTSAIARFVSKVVRFGLRKTMHMEKDDPGLEMMHQTFIYSPLRSIPATSQGTLSGDGTEGIVTLLNGHFFKGMNMILKDVSAQRKRAKLIKKKEESENKK